MMIQLGTVVAVLTANLVNYGTSTMASNGWRVSWALMAAGAIPLCLAAPFLPDTPPSLASRGRPKAEALAALVKLRGAAPAQVQQEADDVYTAAAAEHSGLGWAAGAARYTPQLLLCLLLGAFRALTGNPLLLFYASEVRGMCLVGLGGRMGG